MIRCNSSKKKQICFLINKPGTAYPRKGAPWLSCFDITAAMRMGRSIYSQKGTIVPRGVIPWTILKDFWINSP